MVTMTRGDINEKKSQCDITNVGNVISEKNMFDILSMQRNKGHGYLKIIVFAQEI